MKLSFKEANPILLLVLICSVAVNGFLVFNPGHSAFEKKVGCSKFMAQATTRIKTYYAEPDTTDTSPSEIFYSEKKSSCIATWDHLATNPALNGTHEELVVFDATTNEALYSGTVYFFNDKSDDDAQMAKNNANAHQGFNDLVKELKN